MDSLLGQLAASLIGLGVRLAQDRQEAAAAALEAQRDRLQARQAALQAQIAHLRSGQ